MDGMTINHIVSIDHGSYPFAFFLIGFTDCSWLRLEYHPLGESAHISMGDLQDPIEWRYVSTIFLAIFCGDIPLHRPEK
jgi:hypothetical protein